jgi:uncharacterized iron-regulated membrane protein
MRIDGKAEGPRQSMSWLHTWTGLPLGWLLYAVFLTGTLSFFQQEITVWMKPELHQSLATQPQAEQLQTALARLQTRAPEAVAWNISLPGPRQTATEVNIRKPGDDPRDRRGGERLTLDSATGEEISPRETRGGGFLYRFHFELYGLDRGIARWIVGFATLLMFVAIVSGIITHKKIFKDFFTFRPNKGPRSWLDAHNASAVLALPFHLVITFSGLLLLMFTLMPWGIDAAYEGGRQQFFQAMNGRPVQQGQAGQGQQGEQRQGQHQESRQQDGQRQQGQTQEGMRGNREAGERRNMQAQGNGEGRQMNRESRQGGERGGREGGGQPQPPLAPPAPLGDVVAMLAHAQQQWPDKTITSVSITNPNRQNAEVEIRAMETDSFISRSQFPSMKFNGVTGDLIAAPAPAPTSIASAIYNLNTLLHMARGSDVALRWLLFLSGLLGTLMIASGLILWIAKRATEQQTRGYKAFGYHLVERLNVASIAGLPIAIAAYFCANRFVPVGIPARPEMEIKIFFIAWLVAAIHATIRPHRNAWIEQMSIAAGLYFALPIINGLTGGRPLWSSLYHQQWTVASVDLACILMGALFAWSTYKVYRKPALAMKARTPVAKPLVQPVEGQA